MKSICIGLLAGTCALALQPQGAEAAKSSVEILHSFGAGLDGLSPHANLINVKGQLYGTTGLGGTQSSGTIFTFDPQTCTSKSCTVRVVYSFCSQQNCADGALPPAGLINAGGVLYGTTQKGGSSGNGTVFSFDPKTGAEQVVYSFCSQQNCTDGQYPDASVLDENGTLYGTTQKGGSSGKGTVFSLDPATGVEQILYSFCGQQKCADGQFPEANLIDVSGTLYGTTQRGGAAGKGTVFSINLSTSTASVLYSFCTQQNCTDGEYPLAALLDVSGTLYGTTYGGGAGGSFGTVFSLDPGTGAENVLHSFCSEKNCTDGEFPYSSLINVGGTLFGATGYGGAYNGGEAFSLDPGTGALTLINSFCTEENCTDGGSPEASFIDVKGMLYGTTQSGGAYGYGTVFAIKNP
jgi:uncharacterized repeat protein (TIGR03803 family)